MVSEINNELISHICKSMKFFDEHQKLPEDKVRIDITISAEALVKLQGKNRSGVINELIIS